MPTFNEEKIIEKSINNLSDFLERKKIDYEILIVDDKSKDKTIEIVNKISKKNKKIILFIRKEKPGFGFSLIDGTKKASGEIVIWTMADLSDDLETIPKMIKKIQDGADMVIASRNMPGGSRGDQNKLKAIGSTIFSRLAKILFLLPIYDITNAFRAFKKEMIYTISLENNNFAISPEFAIKAHKKGYRLAEVPTTYNERKVGEAKTKLFKMGTFYYKMLFRYWFKNIFYTL